MLYANLGSTRARSHVRTLHQHKELLLLRDHLLRLDHVSRRDRFHGHVDESFIERYAEKCASDGALIIAYFEDGVIKGAAELHPPEQSSDLLPEIAFSVETSVRRRGVGSFLFRQLIAEARAEGYRSLRITTGAGNEAMRALANKFGARMTFSHGQSTGTIDLAELRPGLAPPAFAGMLDVAPTIVKFHHVYWRMLLRMYGWGRMV